MVSVCIPIYKPNKNYLQQLANSLKQQTLKQFEVVVSDDSDAQDWVDELFAGLNYVYLKNKTGNGIFTNLNNAIDNANGTHIQILCQDDYCEPQLLETQYNSLAQHPNFQLCYSQSNNVDENSVIINFNNEVGSKYIVKEKLVDYLLVYGCLPGNLSAMMFTKNLYQTLGKFDIAYPYAADFNLCIKAAAHSGLVINLPNYINIRNHSNQASFTINRKVYLHDMLRNVQLLLQKTSINKAAAKKYCNAFYGCMLVRKMGIGSNKIIAIKNILAIALSSSISLIQSFFFLINKPKQKIALQSVKQNFVFDNIPNLVSE